MYKVLGIVIPIIAISYISASCIDYYALYLVKKRGKAIKEDTLDTQDTKLFIKGLHEKEEEQIDKYINNDNDNYDKRPLLIYGTNGVGKSTIIKNVLNNDKIKYINCNKNKHIYYSKTTKIKYVHLDLNNKYINNKFIDKQILDTLAVTINLALENNISIDDIVGHSIYPVAYKQDDNIHLFTKLIMFLRYKLLSFNDTSLETNEHYIYLIHELLLQISLKIKDRIVFWISNAQELQKIIKNYELFFNNKIYFYNNNNYKLIIEMNNIADVLTLNGFYKQTYKELYIDTKFNHDNIVEHNINIFLSSYELIDICGYHADDIYTAITAILEKKCANKQEEIKCAKDAINKNSEKYIMKALDTANFLDSKNMLEHHSKENMFKMLNNEIKTYPETVKNVKRTIIDIYNGNTKQFLDEILSNPYYMYLLHTNIITYYNGNISFSRNSIKNSVKDLIT